MNLAFHEKVVELEAKVKEMHALLLEALARIAELEKKRPLGLRK